MTTVEAVQRRQSSLFGWLSLAGGVGGGALRLRYGWPPLWLPAALALFSLAWPSPRAAVRALARLGAGRSPVSSGAYAHTGAPAGVRAPGWVWAACAGAGVSLALLVWAGRRVSERVPAGPGPLRWLVLAAVTVCVLGGATLLLGRKRPGPHPKSLVKWWGVSRWRRSIPSRLADAVAEAGLVHRAHADALPPVHMFARETGERTGLEYGYVLGRVELAGRPRWAGVGGAVLTLDLMPGRKLPEDVTAAVPVLRAHLRAAVAVVEEVDGGVDTVRLHAYRRHPLREPVDWRTLRPVDSGPDSGLAPFGRSAFAGRQSTFRWRLSTLVVSAPEQGKSTDFRAMWTGLVVQRVPHRVWLLDNKADYRGLRGAAHRVATGPLDGLAMLREFVAGLDGRYERSPAFDTGYEHTPTLAEPLDVLVVGELLDFLAFKVTGPQARAAGERGTVTDLRAEAVELVGYVGRRMRGASGACWAAAQGANKSGSTEKIMEAVRDWFPQRIIHRLTDASLIAPAFGRPAEQAPAHEIPPSLRGVGYVLDDDTGLPVMFRAAWVPPGDLDAAIIEPYRALMGAGQVIPGEVITEGGEAA